MSYGFKFNNNNQQLVIDDRNVKPWVFSGSYVGYNYQTRNVDSNFIGITSLTNSNRLKNRTNSDNNWSIFEVCFIAPNNANCFVAFKLPEAAGRDIWYSPGPMGAVSLISNPFYDSVIAQLGLGGSFTPYSSIYALVETSWLNSATPEQVLAALPIPYFFSADAIPAPGGGYGVQVFKENSTCMFDSNKKHIKLDFFSYAFVEVPNYPGSYGPYVASTSDQKSYSLSGVSNPNNLAFVLPETTSSYFGSDSVMTETRVWYQRNGTVLNSINPESSRLQLSSGNYGYSALVPNTRYNIGTEVIGSLTDTNLTDTAARKLYSRVLALDVTGFDIPYTPTEFPSSYSLSSDGDANAFEGTMYGIQGYYTTVTLTTFNVANGTQLPYTITGNGITENDIDAALDYHRSIDYPITPVLNNYLTVQNNRAYLYLHFRDDTTVEGTETFTLSLNNGKASIAVRIKERKTYAISLISTPVSVITNPLGEYLPSINYFNEGSTIQFSITTKNVPNGAQVAYTLVASVGSVFNDFNSSDVTNGLLTGTVTVSTTGSTGTGIGSFTLTNDMVTEGIEDFQIVVPDPDGSSFSAAYIPIRINDTSAPISYSLKYGTQTGGNIQLNEGDTATFTIVGNNVPNGTRVYPGFANSTFGVDDFIVPNAWYDPAVGLTGVVVNNNTATFSFTVKNDITTEDVESGELKLYSTPDNTRTDNILTTWFNGRIYIYDTSKSIAHYITAYVTSINEGQAFQLDTSTEQYTGTPIYWRITGVDIDDILNINELVQTYDGDGNPYSYWSGIPLSLTGSFTFDIGRSKSFLITMRNDQKLEGTETLGFTLRTNSVDGNIVASKSISVNDTSKPTYAIYNDIDAESYNTANEGTTIRWNIYTSGVPNGTYLYWTNTGTTTAEDFNDGYGNTNYGSVLIMYNAGWFERTIKVDRLTEGTQTITMQLRTGGNFSDGILVATADTVTVNDTSQAPTVSITPTTTNINEGQTVGFQIYTTNLPDGLIYWTNTGTATASDFNDNNNFSSVYITEGYGYFTRTLVNDNNTDGAKTIIIRLNADGNNGQLLATSATVTVNDTSRTPLNEIFTVTPSSVVYPSGVEVKVTGGTPNGAIYWSLNEQTYDQILQLDANGYISSGPASTSTAGANLAPGTYTLYFYFPETNHYRQATWTVTAANPAAGTLLSTFCSSTTKYGTYADGSGGTYNQVIASNSTECGYVPPAGLVISNYSSNTNDAANIDLWGTPSAAYDGMRCKGSDRTNVDMFVSRTFTLSKAATITAYLHVSSEASFDFGELYYDDVLFARGSGNYESGAITGVASAGTHTIKCRYTKDFSVSGGTDTAFVEYSIAE